MFGFANNAFPTRGDYADCSGCSLCLLVCPVWRKTHNVSMTPHGRAKALQHGERVEMASIESCTLCLACHPVCPENIDLVGMILNLRRKGMPPIVDNQPFNNTLKRAVLPNRMSARQSTILLSDFALSTQQEALLKIASLLGNDKMLIGEDNGADISFALEAGSDISSHRLEQFLAPLRRMKKIIVADGLMFRYLKQWLPKSKVVSLGLALSASTQVRRNLRSTDLYVIEPRAYHSDYPKLVKYYNKLQVDVGCTLNLDLQRIAIPATARNLPQRLGLIPVDDDMQAHWMIKDRAISRIVIESWDDREVLEKVCNVPVVHLADLAEAAP